MSLVAVVPFDPHSIVAKAFPFEKFKAHVKKDKKQKDKEKDGDQKDQRPRRLLLDAFSSSVGWRPTGIVPAQIKAFVDKFGSEFRLASLSKLVLPIDAAGNPFVTPEGLLPSPCLSTFNALKILRGKPMADWHPAAKEEICAIFDHGLQVEYVEFQSFTAWQQYMEGAAVQQQSALQPHIVDTAVMFLQWLESPAIAKEVTAVLGSSEQSGSDKLTPHMLRAILAEGKNLDAKFLSMNRGNASHRLKDAKCLLRTSSTESLQHLLQWRKKTPPVIANLFAQQWLLQTDWMTLSGKTCHLEGKVYDVQTLVMIQTTKVLSTAEILVNSDVPRIKRAPLNLSLFREICNVQVPAIDYFARLICKFGGVTTRSLTVLMRRLLVDGEPKLRESFLQGWNLCTKAGKSNLQFSELLPSSEWALMEEKLQDLLDAQTSTKDEKEVQQSVETQNAEAVAKSAPVSQQPAPVTGEAPVSTSQPKDPKQEAEDEQAERVKSAVAADVEVQVADCFEFYAGFPTSEADMPSLPEKNRLFVLPPSNKTRGRPDRSFTLKIGGAGSKGPPWLAAVKESDAILVGLGHNPTNADAVRAQLKEKNNVFDLFKFASPIPVMEKQNRSNAEEYVEYFLAGFGPQWPEKQGNLAWVGPVASHPDRPERLYQCEHQTDPVAALACKKRRLSQVKPIGQSALTKKKRVLTEEQRLLGETSDAEAEEVGQQEQESSSEEAEAEVGCAEDERRPWVKMWRQGLSVQAWTQLLGGMNCSFCVLCRPFNCQIGFLLAVLQLADKRVGLGKGFSAVCFGPGEPGAMPHDKDSSAHREWRQKVNAWHQAGHTLDLCFEVYTQKRNEYAVQIAQSAPKQGHLSKRLRQLFKRKSEPVDLPPNVAPVPDGQSTTRQLEPMVVLMVPETPQKENEPDSEDEDPANLDKEALSKWNERLMAKHHLKVMAAGNTGSLGLFSVNDLPSGTKLRLKGAWFGSEEEVKKHIAAVPDMASRIVKVDFPNGSQWCLLSSLFGLLRPGGRAATANFTFDTGRAVTHGLQLELKKAVPAGRELTFFKAKPKAKAKAKRSKK